MRRPAHLLIIWPWPCRPRSGQSSRRVPRRHPTVPDAPAGGELPRYDVVGRITGDSSLGPVGRGMNENGTIVGWAGLAAHGVPVGRRRPAWTPCPGWPATRTGSRVDVNDAGIAVGHSGYETIEPPQHAVRWIDGVPEELGHPWPHRVPRRGDQRGRHDRRLGLLRLDTHAFVWTEAGGMVDITPTAQFGVRLRRERVRPGHRLHRLARRSCGRTAS